MKEQARQVLEELQRASFTYMSNLAHWVGAPEASVRRSIQELRRLGYNITADEWGVRLWNK